MLRLLLISTAFTAPLGAAVACPEHEAKGCVDLGPAPTAAPAIRQTEKPSQPSASFEPSSLPGRDGRRVKTLDIPAPPKT